MAADLDQLRHLERLRLGDEVRLLRGSCGVVTLLVMVSVLLLRPLPPLPVDLPPLELLLPLLLAEDPRGLHPHVQASLVAAVLQEGITQYTVTKHHLALYLAVLAGAECDGAVPVLDAAVGVIVPTLHGPPEECPTAGANLLSVLIIIN